MILRQKSVNDTSSSGDKAKYTGNKNENDDSDLEVYFNNENEYLHILNIQQTEDNDP